MIGSFSGYVQSRQSLCVPVLFFLGKNKAQATMAISNTNNPTSINKAHIELLGGL